METPLRSVGKQTRRFATSTASLSALSRVIKSTSKLGAVTTVKYRNYTKEGCPLRGTNDPLGCLDSWRVSTLCSRERSRRKARFKAGVNFAARPGAKETRKEAKGVEKVVEKDEDISCGCGPVCGAVLTRPTDQYTPANPSDILPTCPCLFRFFPPFILFRDGTRLNRREDRIAAGTAARFFPPTSILLRCIRLVLCVLVFRETCYFENSEQVHPHTPRPAIYLPVNAFSRN